MVLTLFNALGLKDSIEVSKEDLPGLELEEGGRGGGTGGLDTISGILIDMEEDVIEDDTFLN